MGNFLPPTPIARLLSSLRFQKTKIRILDLVLRNSNFINNLNQAFNRSTNPELNKIELVAYETDNLKN